ncbi:hypothetical protein DICPUDRAFT_156837 [Dictyostelium purpureum]|uniref:Uncharacterized protein n=1 Tax=Dictyostelium purpureum TaxID=5786 RepID=F0ZXK0_DICPU|nr:uncharacterized protein DICPUDRAFT_156837 [Dictyostelium purpureum]EGC31339.1 hypothetical protein DICPUDRAFT_156837 [Dictyostelium purpureum]|eukprot:XP_003292148.1 hypothetical protein DICPUDRAFT_156837 [Dictyostelium purpureum]
MIYSFPEVLGIFTLKVPEFHIFTVENFFGLFVLIANHEFLTYTFNKNGAKVNTTFINLFLEKILVV